MGAIVDCIFEHTRTRDSLSERSWRIVVQAVETALEVWKEKDRGIWEVRGEPQHFTFSKVMCWVAADRGARLAALRGETQRAEKWWQAAREIHVDVCANAVSPNGYFGQYYGSDELDASLALLPSHSVSFHPPIRAFARPCSPLRDDLSEGPFTYRYLADTTDDGLNGDEEGSFNVCSFWLVSALVEIGELIARAPIAKNSLAPASVLGLLAEEIDPNTERHLGNFPQALTHLALINALLQVMQPTT